MLHGTTRPGVAGSELNRLLARLADPVPAPPVDTRPALVDRLGHWLGWTGAIALSEALAAGPVASLPGGAAAGPAAAADWQRVRAALEAANAAGLAEPADTASSPTDFAPHRRHIAARQQAMHEAVAALRQRLRDALARRGAQGARLAALDAVLERHLAPHERSLLALVSLRLQARFERGVAAAAASPDEPARVLAHRAFQAAFHEETARVLQAELAHRLLPAQGLLDTLRDMNT